MATAAQPVSSPTSRVIFTEGGKGGVGKTTFMTGLVEWFEARQIPYSLLDLDTENEVRGSLAHYFRDKAKKVNIHTADGLDAIVGARDQDTPIVLADLGAGSGHVAHQWFQATSEQMRERRVAFTAVSVITPDPSSVESVLRWASELQRRVDYLIVKNALTYPADFSHWERNPKAEQFRQFFRPQEIEVEHRVPQFENLIRHFGVTVGQAADRKVKVPELQQTSVVLRAQAYRPAFIRGIRSCERTVAAMSSATADGIAPSEKDPLLSLAKQLPEAQDREWYAELVSYIRTLQPTDELVKIAQLFGFLTLMGQKLPEEIADKQSDLRDMLLKAQAAFQKHVETNASYHEKLNERLNQLPVEIANGVKPEAIVKVMTESFRQQIQKTGLQETQALLSVATNDLKKTTKDLCAAIEPITAQYNDLAYKVEKRAANLNTQGNNLAQTAEKIQKKNAELVAQAQNVSWWSIVALTVFALMAGVFGGITWEQHNVADLVVGLQNQIGKLQQAVQTPISSVADPAGRKNLRKK